jgi:IclR family acetate operon transcriptional repressor
VLEREPVVEAARPVLEEATRGLGETFFLVGARAGQLLVLDKVEGTGFLRASPRIGSRVPVHATAVGKLYLAFAPELVEPPGEAAEAFTRSTLTEPAALGESVQRVSQRGWSASRNEWIQGLSVLAAPVWVGERLLGAVALAAASPRMEELGGDALAERVVLAAKSIEARLNPGGEG